MADGTRIPTPLKHRWRRFRYNVLPVLCFLACIAATLWLWNERGRIPQTIGEVEAVRLPVAAGVDGKLAPLYRKPFTLFDRVQGNEIIARLDDSIARASVATLQTELAGLAKKLQAAAETIRLDEEARMQNRTMEERRVALDVERMKLEALDRRAEIGAEQWDLTQQAEQTYRQAVNRRDQIKADKLQLELDVETRRFDVIDRKATIEADKVELTKFSAQIEYLEGFRKKDKQLVDKFEIESIRLDRDRTKEQLKERKKALKEAEEQLDGAKQRRDQYAKESTATIEAAEKECKAALERRDEMRQLVQSYIDERRGALAMVEGQTEDAEKQKAAYEAIEQRVAEKTKALDEAVKLWSQLNKQLGDNPPLTADRLAKLLAPIRADMGTQQARIREVELQIDALEIRAPINGTICAIHSWPGQFIRAGEPIVTIAADEGRYAVAYVRQEQRFHPRADMEVYVRARGSRHQMELVTIERVGPQFELIPTRLLRDPRTPEWGRPIRIALPKALPLMPGELIDIKFTDTQVKKKKSG